MSSLEKWEAGSGEEARRRVKGKQEAVERKRTRKREGGCEHGGDKRTAEAYFLLRYHENLINH